MENKWKAFQEKSRKFLREKGYYMVLALCIAAVAVSGYLFVQTAGNRDLAEEQPSLSVPLTTEKPQDKTPAQTTDGQATETVVEEDSQEETQEQEPQEEDTAQEEPEPAVLETVRPVSGETVAVFAMDQLAYNTTTQDWRTHEGVDLAAAVGDDVVAARAGTVAQVYDDDALGTTVVVRHDDGYTTYYANLQSETAVTAGDTVDAGTVLGQVGQTATVELAQEAHLHFAVCHNDQPVDPEAFLSGSAE